MPTCFIIDGIRFFFYSNDHKPIHIHVSKGKGGAEAQAKFNLIPEVRLIENDNFSGRELIRIQEIIEERRQEIITKWLTHFDK